MRLRLLGISALALFACQVGPTVEPDTGKREPPAKLEPAAPLDNSSIELAVPEDPSISYAAWFRVGSQDDPPGKEGLAWLTARMLAEGGTTSNPWQRIVELLYPMAASWRVSVDREMTVFTGRSHVDTAAAYQALLVQQWTAPAFDARDFERLRSEGKSFLETTLRYSSDEELGKAGLEGFVFAGTRYAHPPVGTVAGLSAITLDDVREFHRTHYTADRVVFAIGGRYADDSLAALEATRAQLLEHAPNQPIAAPAPRKLEGKQVLLIDKPGADASISFGHPIALRRGDPDFHALWLANSWLGEHRNSSSHLYQVIREARGLNYGDYSYIEAYPGGGWRQMPPTNVGRRAQLFQIWIRTLPNEQAVFALKAAHRELAGLVERGMTAEEFELTREFLRKYALHFAETTDERLGYAIDDRFYGLDHSHLDRFVAGLDALTLDQVNAAIREHFDPANLDIVIVTGQAATIREQLLSSEPTTITYASPKSDAVLSEDRVIGEYALGIAADAIRVVPVDSMFAE
ncbi:M16 family metallopeptidase [Nannocystaceae bacterium ST9]